MEPEIYDGYEKPLRVTNKKVDEILKDIGWCIDLLGNESKRVNQGITIDDLEVEFSSSLVVLIHLIIQQREIRNLSNKPPIEGLN